MEQDRPMYRWRQMTPDQRKAVLESRQLERLPWHGPPHYVGECDVYMITAACYEHRPVIGLDPQRMATFEAEMLETVRVHSKNMFAWTILPNHYHVLLHAIDIKCLLKALGQLHGRTSYCWNGQEKHRGRHVWHRAAETAMKSERHFWATLNYVLHNAVHHGYVEAVGGLALLECGPVSLRSWSRNGGTPWREYPILDYGKDMGSSRVVIGGSWGWSAIRWSPALRRKEVRLTVGARQGRLKPELQRWSPALRRKEVRWTVASQNRLKPGLQRWSPAFRRKEVRWTVASQNRLKPELHGWSPAFRRKEVRWTVASQGRLKPGLQRWSPAFRRKEVRLTVASQGRLKPGLQRWSPAFRRKEVRRTVASQNRLKPGLQRWSPAFGEEVRWTVASQSRLKPGSSVGVPSFGGRK